MTLAEYKNQVNPVFMPDVVLEESEIKRHGRFTDRHNEEYESIYINGYDYNYELAIKTGIIWSTQSNGRRKPTCFRLKKAIHLKTNTIH